MSKIAEIINFPAKKEEEGQEIVKADTKEGFDMLAHQLTDALANPPVKLSGREYQIVFALITKTYRWQKSTDWVNNVQLSEITGISQSHISELKKSLMAKKLIRVEGRYIGINPVISEWGKTYPKTGKTYPKTGNKIVTRKRVNTYPETGNDLPENGEEITPKRGTQKKETITKETITKEKCIIGEDLLPDFLPKDLWSEFITMRKTIKKPVTENIAKRMINKLNKFQALGINAVEQLTKSIDNSWSDIYEPKNNTEDSANNASATSKGYSTRQQKVTASNQQAFENFVNRGNQND